MRRMRLITLSCLVALHVPVMAQAPASSAQPPAAPAQPAFRTGTTLVEVSAIVTRDGRPVTDLRADEVTVLDNGEAQPLSVFEFVDLSSVEGPAQRRDVVLVLDDLHIAAERTRPTQDAARALMAALGPHDRLAVVTTGPHEIGQELSTERAAADAAVERFRGQRVSGPRVPMEQELRTRQAMQVVQSVAAAFSGEAAERRTVLIISEGHPMPFDEGGLSVYQSTFADYLAVVRAAASSNVAIYAIDPRGLQAPYGGASGHSSVTPSGAIAAASSAATTSRALSARFGSLALLTENTGGLLTVWTNDLAADIPRLIQDSRQYYRLAYAQPEVEPGKKQPRSRRIEVKVSRPGLEVRARQRYVPSPS